MSPFQHSFRPSFLPLVLLSASCLLAPSLRAHDADELKLIQVGNVITERAETGEGAYKFATVPSWGEMPGDAPVGPTHGGVAVDKSGLVYVSTDSPDGIRVFSHEGKFLHNLAPEFAGTHSLMIREENGVEYLYGAHLRGARAFKMTLEGKALLTLPFPPEAQIDGKPAYGPKGEGYKPTSVAVAPDGSIFVADGYGTSLIHKYTADGKYVKTFGGKGTEDGKFKACHGVGIDLRSGQPRLLVCDRENRRLQYFDLDGNFQSVVITGLRRPCSISFHGDLVAIAELESRVTILDKDNHEVAHLGDNPDKTQWAKFDVAPAFWKPGIFTAPHGISWDAAGNLYVQDWNKTGRVTKLEPLK